MPITVVPGAAKKAAAVSAAKMRTTAFGTDRPFAALPRFRPVTELLSTSRRARRHARS